MTVIVIKLCLLKTSGFACCSLLLTRSLLGFAGLSTQDQCPFPRRHRAVATRQRASSRVRCRWGLWQRRDLNRWGCSCKPHHPWARTTRVHRHPRRPWVCPHRARTTRVRPRPHRYPTGPPLHRNGWRRVQRLRRHVISRSSGT